LFDQWWPVIAAVLHQPISDIKAMTVDQFDDAIAYLKQQPDSDSV
jgi:hypothetical protein